MSLNKGNLMFNNTVKAEWLGSNKRKMRLIESVSFRDKSGVIWIAHAGDVVDGASIPRFFWRFIGSPFIGNYRRASVIHDVYCQIKVRSSEDTHNVFRDMMEFDGVSGWKARAMYYAVMAFGPKW